MKENKILIVFVSTFGVLIIIGLIGIGRILERTENNSETLARIDNQVTHTIQMQGVVSKEEWRELKAELQKLHDIHVRKGDL